MEKKYGENEKEEVEGDEERDFELLCGESRERKKGGKCCGSGQPC